jgi:ribonuclease J
MLGWVKPETVIPVHGEPLHLHEHATLARRLGFAALTCRNGDVVRLAPGRPEVIDEVRSGRLYKDGALLIDAEARTVADRKRLGHAGIVMVALVISDKGALLANPEVELIGIPERDGGGEPMAEVAYRTVADTVEQLPRPRRRDPDSVEEAVRRAVRAALGERWGKKPNVTVRVLVV